jgi:poly(3-hydroxyalkanoate) depolymerase
MPRSPGGRAADTEFAHIGLHTVRAARWKADTQSPARPLLFFNGIGANIELMSPLADWFRDRDIITFDMPGVGRSPSPVAPYRPWMMARFTAKLLDRFNYPIVDVMGVSWGGGMAQQIAFQYPRRIGKVILCATSAGTLMVPGDVRALSKMASPRRYADPDFMRANFKTLYGDERALGGDDHSDRVTPPSRIGYLYQLGAMLGWTSAFFLPFLKQKTLVMMGDKDRIVPLVNGQTLQRLIPNARLDVVPNGGHLFLMSKARDVVPRIAEFLGEPDAVKAPRAI